MPGLVSVIAVLSLNAHAFCVSHSPINLHAVSGSRRYAEVRFCDDRRDIGKFLANPNKMPVVVGDIPDQAVEVSPDFDWEAQKLIVRHIDQLIGDVEANWADLANEFDNKDYCITFRHEASVRNYTVGDICRMIVAESLSQAYREDVPHTKVAYYRFLTPEIAREEDFGKWCLEQKKNGRKFWELQIQMCDEAIALLRTCGLPGTSKAQCEASIRKIEARKREITRTQMPVLLRSIIVPELRRRITVEDVARSAVTDSTKRP